MEEEKGKRRAGLRTMTKSERTLNFRVRDPPRGLERWKGQRKLLKERERVSELHRRREGVAEAEESRSLGNLLEVGAAGEDLVDDILQVRSVSVQSHAQTSYNEPRSR